MTRICVMVMAPAAMLALLSAAPVFAWSCFEDFEGVASGSYIITLVRIDETSGKDMNVEAGHHAGSGSTGNCTRGNTSAISADYYKLLNGVPATGLLQLSAKQTSASNTI